MPAVPEEPSDQALAEAVDYLVALGARLGSRAPWDAWCEAQSFPVLGVGPPDVARWLRSVAGHLDAPEIDEVLGAVAAGHLRVGLADPTQGARVGGRP